METNELKVKLTAIADGLAELIMNGTVKLQEVWTLNDCASLNASVLDNIFVTEYDGRLHIIIDSGKVDGMHDKFLKDYYEQKMQKLTEKVNDALKDEPK